MTSDLVSFALPRGCTPVFSWGKARHGLSPGASEQDWVGLPNPAPPPPRCPAHLRVEESSQWTLNLLQQGRDGVWRGSRRTCHGGSNLPSGRRLVRVLPVDSAVLALAGVSRSCEERILMDRHVNPSDDNHVIDGSKGDSQHWVQRVLLSYSLYQYL